MDYTSSCYPARGIYVDRTASDFADEVFKFLQVDGDGKDVYDVVF